MRIAVRRLAGKLLPLPAVVATLLVAACGDGSDTPSLNPFAPDPRPSFEIRDGARNAGLAGFYFAPPIAPTVAYPGTFDPNRSPVVEICAWTGTACSGAPVATYSRTSGTGGTTISVDPTAQLYRVDWPTVGLPAGQLYRIRVLEGTTELGHADAKVPGSGESASSLTAQGIVPLGNSARLAIRFRIEQNHAPVVTITAPADGAVIPTGSQVTLTGTATDQEQGDVSSQIVWRSSQVPSPLGTGPSITVTLPGGKNTISASVTDANGATTTVTRNIVVSIISAPPTLNVPLGGTASLPITLSAPAPSGGIALTVTSTDPAKVGIVTPTITIPAGQQSANVTVQGTGPGTATVTASNADWGSASSQVSTTANLDIVQSSVAFAQGRTEQITVKLQSGGADAAAPSGGLTVDLTSANAGCAGVTSPITIPAGLVSATATVQYGGSATTPCTTQITASAAGIPQVTTDVMQVTVNPAPTITVYGTGTRIGAGLRHGCFQIAFAAPAPTGGVQVTVSSSDGSKAQVVARQWTGCSASGLGASAATSTFTLQQGNQTGEFWVDGLEGQSGNVTVTASATGYSNGSAAFTVAPVALGWNWTPPSTTTTFSSNSLIGVYVGPSNAAGTDVAGTGTVRPGGTPISVNFTNSNSAVGQLALIGGGTGQTVTATINPGQSSTPPGTTGAPQFDPIDAGTTEISVSSPTAIVGPSASPKTVTVSAPTITVGGNNTRIGAGLRHGCYQINFGAPAPTGGVQVTVSSSDGSKAQVVARQWTGCSASGLGASAATSTFTLQQGNQTGEFWVDGLEGQTGDVTVSASATGFTGGSSSFTVAPLAVAWNNTPPSSTTTLSNNTPVTAYIGPVNQAGTDVGGTQPIRPGGSPITLTFTNANASVGQLVNGDGAAQTRTATIAVGQYATPYGVASGGVEFDPLASGQTTVTVGGSGIVSGPSASYTVNVSAPAITLQGNGARVGAGLRAGYYQISLGAPAPAGGLALTLTSSAGNVLRLSSSMNTNDNSVGTATTTVTVPQGNSYAYFWLHGMEGQSGTPTVTASAPGFTNASISVTVAPVALAWNHYTTSVGASANNVPVTAYVGPVNAQGTDVSGVQTVRPGGTPIVVTFSNGTASVAQFVTSGGAAQTRTATVAVGEYMTPYGIANGGVEFDPLSPGTTVITLSAPGAVSGQSAQQTVTVTASSLAARLATPVAAPRAPAASAPRAGTAPRR